MINCRVCQNEITRDRYNLAVEGERQDQPPNGDWQHLTEIPLENVCPHCFDKIIAMFKAMVRLLIKKKGVIE